MKKIISLALIIMTAVNLSSCAAQQIFPENITERKGVELVRLSPWMLKLALKGENLKEQGIEKLSALEVVTMEDSAKIDAFSSEIDNEIKKMKLSRVLEVREKGQNIDMLVKPIEGAEGMAEALIVKVVEPDELTLVGMLGEFNFAKMLESGDMKTGNLKIAGIVSVGQ